MTVLGKILAILNLVLSLAVGALIVMTFVGRTNWHQAYLNMENQVNVSKADALAFKKEMEDAKGEKAKTEDQLAKYKQATDKEKAALNDQLNDLGDKLKRASAEIGKHVASQAAADQELQRRAREMDHLRTLVATRDDELKKKEKSVNDMRAAMVEATINYNAERERNERLLQENERLNRDNRQIRQVTSTTSLRREAPKKNPPAEDVGGRVMRTDPQTGMVTINIGSDLGVNKGNTLEVFRLNPDPKYLGTIEILGVLPNEAVGKPIERMNGPIKVGDQVSSSIMGRR